MACQHNTLTGCSDCQAKATYAELESQLAKVTEDRDRLDEAWGADLIRLRDTEAQLAKATAERDRWQRQHARCQNVATGVSESYAQALERAEQAEAQVAALASMLGREIQALLASLPAAAEKLLAAQRQDPALVEILADIEHERWAGWMAYLFGKADHRVDGSCYLPADVCARWQRQVATNYRDLSEQEKESDRIEVRKTLAAIAEWQQTSH